MLRPKSAQAEPAAAPQPEKATQPSLRADLEAVAPSISYPELAALTKVLTELALQFAPLSFDDLSDRVGDELADLPAEQIRLALRLLGAGAEHRFLRRTPAWRIWLNNKDLYS